MIYRFKVLTIARDGSKFVDPVRSEQVAMVMAAEARRHGDMANVIVERWEGGRWLPGRDATPVKVDAPF